MWFIANWKSKDMFFFVLSIQSLIGLNVNVHFARTFSIKWAHCWFAYVFTSAALPMLMRVFGENFQWFSLAHIVNACCEPTTKND